VRKGETPRKPGSDLLQIESGLISFRGRRKEEADGWGPAVRGSKQRGEARCGPGLRVRGEGGFGWGFSCSFFYFLFCFLFQNKPFSSKILNANKFKPEANNTK